MAERISEYLSQYLSSMARLTDITLYDLFHPAEGQRHFQQRANYVGELYLQGLGDYKPPKTSRISIDLVSEHRPPYAYRHGSIALTAQSVNTPWYDGLSDSEKLHFLLNCVHAALLHLGHAFHWDLAVLAHAYEQAIADGLVFRVQYPEKATRDGKRRARLLLEKTVTTTCLSACIDADGQHVQALLYQGPNWGFYDPVYAVVKHGKWLTRDAFGVHTTRPECRVWYALPEGRVCQEHPLACLDFPRFPS